ncbi:MAG: helical backbone metal receptor [Cyclobacteriaceae bacterium]|nr:ABC transporter substrate-binding protein [Cyclobacteriaceae bacterium]MCH8514902.1 helical backbone metal receptor [Cyclobacteriaceae bacterium]
MPIEIKDQIGRNIQLDSPASNIVSLVPSITELVADLAGEESILACTEYCVHPEGMMQNKLLIGGTKNVKKNAIKKLYPDLIFCSKEENRERSVRDLMDLFPVYVSDVKNLNEARQMIEQIGLLLGKQNEAADLIKEITLFHQSPLPTIGSCVYLIWDKPIMTAGGDTFIHNLLEFAGYRNLFADQIRYPQITLEDLKSFSPDFLFLSSEPFPYGDTELEKYTDLLKPTRVLLVDGEMFSWYGSRLRYSYDYFNHLAKKIENMV